MGNDFFQKVFDIIQPLLPVGWNKVILYVGYTAGSYSMKFYICDKKNNYTDCFSMKSIEKAQLIKLFMNIDKIITPERNGRKRGTNWNSGSGNAGKRPQPVLLHTGFLY